MMETPQTPQTPPQAPNLESSTAAPSSEFVPIAKIGERSGLRTIDLRLRKHADYQRVYKATRKQFSQSMSWFVAARPAEMPSSAKIAKTVCVAIDCAPIEASPRRDTALPQLPGPRVGLTAGKVLGKAHERNRIKRRMREAVRHSVHALPQGVDVILHPKRSVMTMDFVKLEAEVLRIFRQAAAQVRQARESSLGRMPAARSGEAGPRS